MADIVTRYGGAGKTAAELSAASAVASSSASGVGSVLGTPMLVSETSAGSNLYPLPYTKEHPVVWVGGSIQVKDVDYTVNSAGQVSFTPALVGSPDVIATCAIYPTVDASRGGGAMTVPAVVAADSGSGNAVYSLPGTGGEMVWKGGAIQVPGADYVRSSNKVTFVAGNVPAAGEEVVISVATYPMVGTDARSLNGAAGSIGADVNSVAIRGADSTLKASNHASVGSPASEGSLVALDSTGKIPAASVPSSIDAATLSGAAGSSADTASTVAVRGSDFTLKARNHASIGSAAAEKTVVVLDNAGKIPAAAIGSVPFANLTGSENVALKNAANSFTAAQAFAATALTDAATVAWNLSANQVATLTLTAGVGSSRTIGAPTNHVAGAFYSLMIVQSSAGSYTVAWNAAFKWQGGSSNTPTVTATANAVDLFVFRSDGTSLYEVGRSQNVG